MVSKMIEWCTEHCEVIKRRAPTKFREAVRGCCSVFLEEVVSDLSQTGGFGVGNK